MGRWGFPFLLALVSVCSFTLIYLYVLRSHKELSPAMSQECIQGSSGQCRLSLAVVASWIYPIALLFLTQVLRGLTTLLSRSPTAKLIAWTLLLYSLAIFLLPTLILFASLFLGNWIAEEPSFRDPQTGVLSYDRTLSHFLFYSFFLISPFVFISSLILYLTGAPRECSEMCKQNSMEARND